MRKRSNPLKLSPQQKAANARSWTYAYKAAAKESRKPPLVTCPASRHVRMMADALRLRGEYLMFGEEPVHCSESLYVTVLSLWRARHRIAELEKQLERA
jgi:hypothetical protein